MKIFKKQFQYGEHQVILEQGRMARQATASVLVKMGDTEVLVTVVAAKEAKEGQSFFPLTVMYQKRLYSSGRIPGGYLKREGRPTDRETLAARLIDRPLRPLFPEGFLNEVQIVATVLSLDPKVDAEIPAMIGASAAVALSGVPFAGPIGAARVGYVEGQYVLNPNSDTLKLSDLDLVVAGTADAVLMVESEAKELPEDVMLGAVMYGHEQMQVAIQAISELVAACGQAKWDWQPKANHETVVQAVETEALEKIKAAYGITAKQSRQVQLKEIKKSLLATLVTPEKGFESAAVVAAFEQVESHFVRESILNGALRIDGRDHRTVRPIHIQRSVLSRTHGSALFTRGETQALVVTTLGNDRDAQTLEGPQGNEMDRFMLHYNFPPFCVGETGPMTGPKRREIGHGNLARRAINPMLPSETDFPYVIRVVSEILESNGSSSMASVCGAALSLLDAGVPLKAPVAGIAMGLIKEGERFAVLTDILGDEDHLGDMDFKVAGSEQGITALQMDIKITGITKEIMHIALEQAKEGRLHILRLMNQVITAPAEMSPHAPRIYNLQVKPEKIREIIGKGGATIRQITDETGVSIDLKDDGSVSIFAVDSVAAQAAIDRISAITAEVEVNKIYEGEVVRLADFGAFVNLLPGKDGLVHVSQISAERVEKVEDVLALGQRVRVKVLEIDRQGRVRLTMKDLDESATDNTPSDEASS